MKEEDRDSILSDGGDDSEFDDSEFGDMGDGFEALTGEEEFGEIEEDFAPLMVAETAQEPVEAVKEPITETTAPEAAEATTEPVTEAKTKPPKKKSRTAKPIRKPMSKRKKVIRKMLRRAGVDEVPELNTLMGKKTGMMVAIKDIGLFICEPESEILKGVHKQCPIKNTVNLSAEVTEARVTNVGSQILNAQRMFTPIQVARITDSLDKELQCTSGRHRLAFLALVYGADVEIPVYVEEMDLNEARDAVVVANMARPTKALEKAEHAVLRAVSGNADAQQDEIYSKMVKTKAMVRHYCTYSVVERKYPKALTFPVSDGASREGGVLTTINNLGGFWNNASDWITETKRKDFDKSLKQMVTFVNAMAAAMEKMEGFDPSHHMAAMTFQAVGKYYRAVEDTTKKPPDAAAVAKAVVSLGEVGRQKAEKTYSDLKKAV